MTESKRSGNLREPNRYNVELGDFVVVPACRDVGLRLLTIDGKRLTGVHYCGTAPGWSTSGNKRYEEVIILKKNGEYLVGSEVPAYALQSDAGNPNTDRDNFD